MSLIAYLKILKFKCGCRTWILILSEERRLKIFGNRALRRIFEPNRVEVMGGWTKPHNEEL
jgi:hypothetical protein